MRIAPVVSSFSLLTALLLAPPTLAAPSEADKVRARALMDQGDALVEKQQLSDALTKYREAHTLMKVTTTGIEVARVLEQLGRLVEAREVAAEVAAIPAVPGESPALTSARNAAAALLKGLDARVPSVTVRMRGAGTDAVLRVDGKPVAASALGAPHRLDPGPHQIEAASRGEQRAAQIELAEGDHETVTLDFSASVVAAPTPKPGAVRPAERSPTLGYVIGGIGVAGLATAAVTGALILSRDGKIEDNCPEKRCNAEGRDLVDGSRTLLTVNAVAFGVGVVGTGLGAYLVLTSGPGGETAIAPRVGPRSAGVAWLGRF
ncbi:MAG: hypothetical protein IPM35_14000 [Myxococcales bacterium]|nr:hypothetical protein [Myxococcales bacterium]